MTATIPGRNDPLPPGTVVPWSAVEAFAKACGVEMVDRRWLVGLNYDRDTRVVTVTRVRLSPHGNSVNAPDGRLVESFELVVE